MLQADWGDLRVCRQGPATTSATTRGAGLMQPRVSHRHSMPYRPEIDGLRAIAVISVILFHARVPGVPGGHLGVDA